MKCKFVKNGQKCKASAVKESGFCYFHDPRYAEQRKQQLAKGSNKQGGKKQALVFTLSTDCQVNEDNFDYIIDVLHFFRQNIFDITGIIFECK